MKVRNGETPIKLPPIVRADDPVTARWANSIRDALQRLRDRVPVIKGASGGSSSPLELPFEIYIGSEIPEGGTTSEVFIGARDGVFDGVSLTNIKEYSPANGTWTLQAKIVINADTGEITSREVLFLDTPGTQTATNFFATIGSIQVIDGAPDPSTIIQANYGPLYNVLYGGADEKWKAAIF